MNTLDFRASFPQHQSIDIVGINSHLGVSRDFDISTTPYTVYVDYKLIPNMRNWGLDSIDVKPSIITTVIDWEIDTEDMTQADKDLFIKAGGKEYSDNISGSIDVDSMVRMKDKAWTIKCETHFKRDGSFAIDNIEIDFQTLTITLQSDELQQD
ncbi:MAG: hypothetical protein V4580_17430 [Bacteroidota bacterium]